LASNPEQDLALFLKISISYKTQNYNIGNYTRNKLLCLHHYQRNIYNISNTNTITKTDTMSCCFGKSKKKTKVERSNSAGSVSTMSTDLTSIESSSVEGGDDELFRKTAGMDASERDALVRSDDFGAVVPVSNGNGSRSSTGGSASNSNMNGIDLDDPEQQLLYEEDRKRTDGERMAAPSLQKDGSFTLAGRNVKNLNR